jgi:hypothetical protein
VNIQPASFWIERVAEAGFLVVRQGGDAWWDPPYGDRVPAFVYKALSQAMFALRLGWPISSGENTVFLARLSE